MNLFGNQSWNELARPTRWDERLRPAMGALESRLPGMLGAGFWLHRNVSSSDLERIKNPGSFPPTGNAWPVMYLVCWYRKVLIGFQLVNDDHNDYCDPDGTSWRYWKNTSSLAEGIPFFSYFIGADALDETLEQAMKDICLEARKSRKQRKPLWLCTGEPIHFDKGGESLAKQGLVKKEAGNWTSTERGEDCGLMTLFMVGRAGAVTRELRWSPATRKAQLCRGDPGSISFQARVEQLQRGFASCDAYAAEAVRRLAEMPLEEYFQSCPEVNLHDMRNLQKMLNLQNKCQFRTAAAALYRRMLKAKNKMDQAGLMSMLKLFALPIAKWDESERSSVLENFRKGRVKS